MPQVAVTRPGHSSLNRAPTEKEEGLYETRTVICMIATTIMFTVLAFSLRLAAPDEGKNHLYCYCHYKLIDMGTLGGPQSYLNGFEYHGAVQPLNKTGTLAGWADTCKWDPYCPSEHPAAAVDGLGSALISPSG